MSRDVSHITGVEAISRPFVYTVTLHSEDDAVDIEASQRSPYTINLPLPGGSFRYVNGLITRAERGESTRRSTRYTYEIRPWFWLLGQQRGCALFQDISVPDIVKKVCGDAGFADIGTFLAGEYPAREYTVQYNENSLDFLSRLMAESGIFYFFTHTQSSHSLVMADSVDMLANCPDCPALSWIAGKLPGTPSAHMQPLALAARSSPRACAVDDYNYLTPSASLKATSAEEAFAEGDFGAGHATQQQGEALAALRADACEAERLELRGISACAGLYPGGTVSVSGCPQSDVNKKWLLTETALSCSGADETSTRFTAVPASAPYRHGRRMGVHGCTAP